MTAHRHGFAKPYATERWCDQCGGEGKYPVDHWRLGPIEEECEACEGTGIVEVSPDPDFLRDRQQDDAMRGDGL